MCGFLVCIGDCPIPASQYLDLAAGLDLLDHRGPDDTELTRIADNVVIGFKRLAIIDAPGSQQPLQYPPIGPDAGRWTLAFNGEIYNFELLRAELRRRHGAVFATNGDAEVVAAVYHYWGRAGLARLRGMFAFVAWDRATGTVHAVRDPFGIKPLHYLHTSDGLWFSSEKRPLVELIDRAALDRDALSLYLTMQYVPEPYTMHRQIRRLDPGSWLTYQPAGEVRIERYHRLALRPAPTADPTVLVADIRAALRDSVRAHLRADVPVGVFLSSGIDSTAVVALAREVDPGIRAFTAGFDLPGYSEIEVAQESARDLDVALTPTVVRPADVIEALPRIMWHLDDPVADPSIIPLYFLARTAAEQVKVVLSGEGADELFGGYQIYREPKALAPVRGLPDAMQRGLRVLAGAIPEGVRGKSYLQRATTPIETRYYGNARIFNDAQKGRLLRGPGRIASYTEVTAALYGEAAGLDDVATMQHIDLNTWLPGDLLTKADRMSMAHALELRVPFLDRLVFEVAAGVPTAMKLPPGSPTTKWAMRMALRGIVPPSIVDRPKLGFPTPTAAWLRGELGGWAHDLLSTSGAGHLLDLDYAHALLVAHQHKDADHARKIWAVLMFCLWHAIVVERSIQPVIPRRVLIGHPPLAAPASSAQREPAILRAA